MIAALYVLAVAVLFFGGITMAQNDPTMGMSPVPPAVILAAGLVLLGLALASHAIVRAVQPPAERAPAGGTVGEPI